MWQVPQNALVIVMTADRGLAGAYNTNVIRFVTQRFDKYPIPVKYITVGRKGRDLLLRMRKPVLADAPDRGAVRPPHDRLTGGSDDPAASARPARRRSCSR